MYTLLFSLKCDKGRCGCSSTLSLPYPRSHISSELHVQAVPDATGREDLVGALRLRLLLAAAAALGCNRLALGDSATRLAARAVALAAKGAGYALPASLQHFDGRRARSLIVLLQCGMCSVRAASVWTVLCPCVPPRLICAWGPPPCSTLMQGAPAAWSLLCCGMYSVPAYYPGPSVHWAHPAAL